MHTVYQSPSEPGAPAAGDLVVVVGCWANPTLVGQFLVVQGTRSRGPVWARWAVGAWFANAVRYPTPEELAAYQLSKGAG